MKEEKISEKDFVTYMLKENNIQVSIKYPKRSTLKKRFEILEKIKKGLYKI
jgi:uncharacterized protein VirK/YbjX